MKSKYSFCKRKIKLYGKNYKIHIGASSPFKKGQLPIIIQANPLDFSLGPHISMEISESERKQKRKEKK